MFMGWLASFFPRLVSCVKAGSHRVAVGSPGYTGEPAMGELTQTDWVWLGSVKFFPPTLPGPRRSTVAIEGSIETSYVLRI